MISSWVLPIALKDWMNECIQAKRRPVSLWEINGELPLPQACPVSLMPKVPLGFPRWLSGKDPACQRKRCRFNLWVRNIPWRSRWQPTPVFLPGKSHGQRNLGSYTVHGVPKKSDPAELLNNKVPSKTRLDPSQVPSNSTESLFQETLMQAPFYWAAAMWKAPCLG